MINLQEVLREKAAGHHIAGLKYRVQLDIDGYVRDARILDIEETVTVLGIAPGGYPLTERQRERMATEHTVKILVEYPAVMEGVQLSIATQVASVSRTCVAPAGCELDWSQVVCAWQIEDQTA